MKTRILAAGLALSLIVNGFCLWRIASIEGGLAVKRGPSLKSLNHDIVDIQTEIGTLNRAVGIGAGEGLMYGNEPEPIPEQIKRIDDRLGDAERKLLFR